MEKNILKLSGFIGLLVQTLLIAHIGYQIYAGWNQPITFMKFPLPVIELITFFVLFGGYQIIQINEAIIITLFGKYKGTLTANGWFYINPFYSAISVDLRLISDGTALLTVNDKNGVPIEIGAIITYHIVDTYKATFAVDECIPFVRNQFVIGLRKFASKHTYAELASDEKEFVDDLNQRCEKAGIGVIDAKITDLNYVPEIAASMLKKQAAQALSDAKSIIVSNAVEIAQEAAEKANLSGGSDRNAFIKNLVIVLCSEKEVTPTINLSKEDE